LECYCTQFIHCPHLRHDNCWLAQMYHVRKACAGLLLLSLIIFSFKIHVRESRLTPFENIRIYRCLQLLTLEFNACFGRICVPMSQFVTLAMNIIILFMSVKLHDHLPLNEFIRFPLRGATTILLISYYFPMLADVQRLSTVFIRFGNKLPPTPTISLDVRKWSSSAVRSCRPMKYGASAMFFMRKYYAFRVFGFVIMYTAKLLMVLWADAPYMLKIRGNLLTLKTACNFYKLALIINIFIL